MEQTGEQGESNALAVIREKAGALILREASFSFVDPQRIELWSKPNSITISSGRIRKRNLVVKVIKKRFLPEFATAEKAFLKAKTQHSVKTGRDLI